MTSGAIDALRADRDELLGICRQLDDADFRMATGCPGWSVKDLVTHLGLTFWTAVDRSVLPDTSGLTTERAADLCVDERRSWSPEQVVTDYESVSAEALARLAGFDGQDFELAMGDIGTYPAHFLPNAFAFDHYTHIRADLFSPRGPLGGTPPPSDGPRLDPTLDWVEAALPQQNPAVMAALPGAIELVLRGAGARTFKLGSGAVTARVTCDAADFVPVITQRASWEEGGVEASGGLEQLLLARTLHVF